MDKRKLPNDSTEEINKKSQYEIPGTSSQRSENLCAFLHKISPVIYRLEFLPNSPDATNDDYIEITQTIIAVVVLKLNINSVFLYDQSTAPLIADLYEHKGIVFAGNEKPDHLNVLFDSTLFKTEPTYRQELFKLVDYLLLAKPTTGIEHFACSFNIFNDSRPAFWKRLIKRVILPKQNPNVGKIRSLKFAPYIRGCDKRNDLYLLCKCTRKYEKMLRLILGTLSTHDNKFTSLDNLTLLGFRGSAHHKNLEIMEVEQIFHSGVEYFSLDRSEGKEKLALSKLWRSSTEMNGQVYHHSELIHQKFPKIIEFVIISYFVKDYLVDMPNRNCEDGSLSQDDINTTLTELAFLETNSQTHKEIAACKALQSLTINVSNDKTFLSEWSHEGWLSQLQKLCLIGYRAPYDNEDRLRETIEQNEKMKPIDYCPLARITFCYGFENFHDALKFDFFQLKFHLLFSKVDRIIQSGLYSYDQPEREDIKQCGVDETNYLKVIDCELNEGVDPKQIVYLQVEIRNLKSKRLIENLLQFTNLKILQIKCATNYFTNDLTTVTPISSLTTLHIEFVFPSKISAEEFYSPFSNDELPSFHFPTVLSPVFPKLETIKLDGLKALPYDYFKLTDDEFDWFFGLPAYFSKLQTVFVLKDLGLRPVPQFEFGQSANNSEENFNQNLRKCNPKYQLISLFGKVTRKNPKVLLRIVQRVYGAKDISPATNACD